MMYRGFKIGVFYKRLSWVEKWMKDFLDNIDQSCVLRLVRNGFTPFMIELKDGTTIKAYRANESPRGAVIDKAFVEYGIEQDIIETVIKPMIKHNIVMEF